MSSCLSGSGRAFRLDLEIIKSPSTSWTSTNSSSPSSTLSESRNSPLSISTRKARTPRKRPNQIYNEAAAILSTAYPRLFPTKHLSKPRKFPDHRSPFSFESLDLLMPFSVTDAPGCLLERSNFGNKPKGLIPLEKACQSPGDISSQSSHVGSLSKTCDDYQEDLDTESILDEEIGEGIDSFMGKLSMENKPIHDANICSSSSQMNGCYGYPAGLGIDLGYGIRRELRAMRNGDEGDWWRFPTVNVADIPKKIDRIPGKKNSGSAKANSSSKASSEDSKIPHPKTGLMLKLNYDNVLNEWAKKDSPFCDDSPAAGNDVQVRLAQIELFPERGDDSGSNLVNKERRRPRSLSKKTSCQVRKVKPDQRPRMKGRSCGRKTNCGKDEEG